MMGRLSRRELLTAAAGLVSAPALAATETTGRKKRLAIVTTVWRPMSHAHHMGDRFLVGYPLHGKWRKPSVEVVSAYVDQFPADDLARSREKEFGFRLVLHHVS